MKILRLARWLIKSRKQQPSASGGPKPYAKNAGNVFFALFAAVAMVGAVGYGFNTVLRGPISAMSETTRRTVAESTLVTSSRLAIVGATTQQAGNGDTDADGMIEPIPYKDAAGGPHPSGGGHIPDELHIPSTIDPWNTQYGYCAWDHGSATASAGRLAGSAESNRYSFAIISAGKNKKFETSCIAYVDDSTQLIQLTPGSDDIVLAYTYAEANNLGNGLWKPKNSTTAITEKSMEVIGGGKVANKVELSGNQTTGGGLILPRDPGDDSLTGACDNVNDKQLRYNVGDGSEPPVIEICDDGGLGWTPVSGGAANGGGTTVVAQLVAHYKLDEVDGTVAHDETGAHDGTLHNHPVWAPSQGKIGGALQFTAGDETYIRVPRSAALEPSSVTVAMWVKRTGAQDSNAGLLTKTSNNNGSPTYHSYGLYMNGASDDSVQWHVGHTAADAGPASTSFLTAGDWYHIIAVYDPAGAAPQSRFYVNGLLNASETDTLPIAYDKTNTGDLYIGGTQGAAGEKFTGYIDDVRIYNYGMTEDQVKTLYAAVNVSSLNLTSPKKPGAVFSWGNDLNEKLGNGTEGSRTAPGPVVNGGDFVQISGGHNHACGVKTDGTAWCWGLDNSGELGNGPGVTGNQSAPYQVTGLSNVIKVTAGAAISCALQKNGKAWCWGSNFSGQLGTGGGDTAEPALVPLSNVIDISAGEQYSTCAVTNDGAGWCWGYGLYGQLGNGESLVSTTPVRVRAVSDFISISVGYNTACGVTKRGIAYCWGRDDNGELGNGSTTGDQSIPNKIDQPEDFVKIDVGSTTACGLRASGKISCWGAGSNGQMGNGTTTATNPLPLEISDPGPFIDLNVSGPTNCAVKKSGTLWCWGQDTHGALGDGDVNSSSVTRPVQVKVDNVYQISGLNSAMYALVDTSANAPTSTSDFSGKFSVAASENDALHACHIRADGTLWCWGVEQNGELGNGGGATDTAANPVAVTDPGPWYQVSAGRDHTCGIKTDGSAWCWGADADGQLGNGGTTGDQVSPSPVTNTDGIPWAQISAGGGPSTCGIKVDGSLWCWGADTNGQLGNGAGGSSTQPSAVTSSLPWTMVSAGTGASCGIKSDSTLWCWGAAANGKLGNGTTTPDLQSPAQIGTDKWSYILTKQESTCGIKTDGSLWCWGFDGNGKLGNGATLTANQTTPSPVAEPGPWRNVSGGSSATCATKIDGTGWCWGLNQNMLGYGALPGADVPYPRQVAGTDWAMIDGGGGSLRCGIKNDASIWCWGNGHSGTTNSPYPLKVYQPYKANFVEADAATTPYAFAPISSMAIGSTPLTDTEGTAQGLSFPGSGRSLLYQGTTANQFMLETAPSGGAAQIWLNGNGLPYYMGYNAYTGGLEFGYGADWLTRVTAPGIELSDNGFVGIGTGGAPVASLDIRGALRVGDAGSGCTGGNSGTIKYAGSLLQYCDGADWVPLAGTTAPGGGGPVSTLPWDMSLKNLAAGMEHTCGIQADGSLWCWGHAGEGRLGNGSTSPNQTAPVKIESSSWTQISAGESNTCGIQADGSLWCWGYKGNGLVGGVSEDQDAPIKIGASSWIQITLGVSHGCAIQADGTGWCWGRDTNEQLGNGNEEDQETPMEIDDGGLWTQISAGGDHTCGIQAYGSLWCWGKAMNGQLGNGSTSPNQKSPVKIGSSSWTQISAGYDHTCGIQADGSLWCWGKATSGQLGNGSTSPETAPVKIGSSSWTQIAAGGGHTCGIQADGSLWCWGAANVGQLGNGTTSPNRTAPVKIGSSSWAQIAAGGAHTCGVQTNGSLWCWGYAYNGQLGNGTTTPDQTTPQRIGP